jgi:hypothetical protein
LKDEFVLEVEQLLRDSYKFYKNSTKGKKRLQATVLRRYKPQLQEFVNTLVRESKAGKKDLEKRPSLRLQCWNATHWLGRSACLISLCKSYEFILEHLTEFAVSSSESQKDKDVAADLYNRLTSYDVFLFIHFYRDLAGTMAYTTRQLQRQDLRIQEVERMILSLCEHLEVDYDENSEVPVEMLGDGTADNVIAELFVDNGTSLQILG